MSLSVSTITGTPNWPTFTTDTGITPAGDNLYIVAGWYYLNSFTAGRFLWSNGPSHHCRLYSATDLEITIPRFTTARTVRTSSAGFVTGVWTFIAYAKIDSNATNFDEEVWIGTPTSAPIAATMTVASAGSGFTTAPDPFRFGASSADANRIDGFVSNCFVGSFSFDFNIMTTINVEYIYNNYIQPIYNMGYDPYQMNGRRPDGGALFGTTSWGASPKRNVAYFPFDATGNESANSTFYAYVYEDTSLSNGCIYTSSALPIDLVYSSFEPNHIRRRQPYCSPVLNTTMRRP